MPPGKVITEKTISENVYDRLLDYIFSDQVRPGEKLVERDLAEKFHVSRVPIREALAKMVAQGLLVDGGHRQGVRVRHYTPAESRQLVEFRFFLERCAIEVAAQRAEAADLELLESVCQEAESIDIANSWEAWGDLDHQFHVAIARASHNARVVASLEGLLTEYHFIFYIHPRNKLTNSIEKTIEMKQRVINMHRQITDAIAAGDGPLAIRLLQHHL
ncbi:MAG: GntR family transcriptional regulator, partial [Planctomycetia bacterium]